MNMYMYKCITVETGGSKGDDSFPEDSYMNDYIA